MISEHVAPLFRNPFDDPLVGAKLIVSRTASETDLKLECINRYSTKCDGPTTGQCQCVSCI